MTISSKLLSGRLAVLATVLLGVSMVIPGAAAQALSSQPKEVLKVIGHLPLNGMHVNQMFLEQQEGKNFLYLHRPMKEAFALVDISNPDKPVLLSHSALKENAGSQVQPPARGSVVAMTVTPDEGATPAARAAVKLPTETVQLVDLSDPSSIKTLNTFSGVTSMYSDDARKLVYLVNGEGLWIVSHHLIRPMPLCTSGDVLNPMPNCQ